MCSSDLDIGLQSTSHIAYRPSSMSFVFSPYSDVSVGPGEWFWPGAHMGSCGAGGGDCGPGIPAVCAADARRLPVPAPPEDLQPQAEAGGGGPQL